VRHKANQRVLKQYGGKTYRKNVLRPPARKRTPGRLHWEKSQETISLLLRIFCIHKRGFASSSTLQEKQLLKTKIAPAWHRASQATACSRQ
jgi:hypothetical protein